MDSFYKFLIKIMAKIAIMYRKKYTTSLDYPDSFSYNRGIGLGVTKTHSLIQYLIGGYFK
jgi:hypothetical protein